MRRFLIDTDTGSDDVWAVIEALRATTVVQVEAITVVCGNFPLDLCVKNAMLAEEAADTYLPPVFRGAAWPLAEKTIFNAAHVHGADGLGGMNLPASARTVEHQPAAEAILELLAANPGEIEIVTCGPLTNLATVLQRDPSAAGLVKRAWILGGVVEAEGNLRPDVEYNVGSDPEAAAIVAASNMNITWVTLDTARGESEITEEDRQKLLAGGTAAQFCARCAEGLRAYYRDTLGRATFSVIDSLVMTTALYPEIITEEFSAQCRVETAPDARGRFVVEKVFGKAQDADDSTRMPDAIPESATGQRVVTAVDVASYKEKLFTLLGASIK